MKMSSKANSRQVFDALLAIAATETGRISRGVLDDHFAMVAGDVLATGLLEPEGDLTVTSMTGNEGEGPVALTWRPETGEFGYFDSSVGWVVSDPRRLKSFRLNVPLFADRRAAICAPARRQAISLGISARTSRETLLRTNSC